MNFKEKLSQLRAIIIDNLAQLIDNDFVLMDLPYHSNIGDILIWEGEIQFLNNFKNKYKLLYSCSQQTFRNREFNKNIIILMHGGGNFGDIWCNHHEFKLNIIDIYKNNKIIIFPQTVFYSDKEKMYRDSELFSSHKNIFICARDKKSYKILNDNFNNKILLVPDMAFCIQSFLLERYKSNIIDKSLFLKRTDKEINKYIDYSMFILDKKIDTHDWRTMEKFDLICSYMNCFVRQGRKSNIIFPKIADIYASALFKNYMIKNGVGFISKYNRIYTTRLHGAILSCLLEKPCTLFNNSYGKNRDFFETWLSDLDEMSLVS